MLCQDVNEIFLEIQIHTSKAIEYSTENIAYLVLPFPLRRSLCTIVSKASIYVIFYIVSNLFSAHSVKFKLASQWPLLLEISWYILAFDCFSQILHNISEFLIKVRSQLTVSQWIQFWMQLSNWIVNLCNLLKFVWVNKFFIVQVKYVIWCLSTISETFWALINSRTFSSLLGNLLLIDLSHVRYLIKVWIVKKFRRLLL